jgi:hypothetical protein
MTTPQVGHVKYFDDRLERGFIKLQDGTGVLISRWVLDKSGVATLFDNQQVDRGRYCSSIPVSK